MRYEVFILTLVILTGCTDNSGRIIERLEDLQRETQSNLQTCQNQLDFYRQGGATTQTEESTSSEPEYETVQVYNIETKYGKATCYTRNNGEDEEIGCGMTFSDCKDGYVYRCMTDVKYKVTQEQKLVE